MGPVHTGPYQQCQTAVGEAGAPVMGAWRPSAPPLLDPITKLFGKSLLPVRKFGPLIRPGQIYSGLVLKVWPLDWFSHYPSVPLSSIDCLNHWLIGPSPVKQQVMLSIVGASGPPVLTAWKLWCFFPLENWVESFSHCPNIKPLPLSNHYPKVFKSSKSLNPEFSVIH